MKGPFDFNELHRDPKVFLDCVHSRSIADIYEQGDLMFSPKNMTDLEVLESIVSDILAVTMWEIQTGEKLEFNKAELLRFVSADQHPRIVEMLEHDKYLLSLLDAGTGEQLRIDKRFGNLQGAMDFCGVWYSSYVVGEGAILVNDRDLLEDLILDPIKVQGLFMELDATHSAPSTLQ